MSRPQRWRWLKACWKTANSQPPPLMKRTSERANDYIRSGQRDDKSPLKRAWFCSRDPFFDCTPVELERSLHCTRWLQSTVSWMPATDNHTSDGRRWCCIHYTLSSIGLICHHVCCKLACITYRQHIDQVEFEHYRSNML